MAEKGLTAGGTSDRVAVGIGTMAAMRACPPSMATTAPPIATVTSALVPLLSPPEGSSPCAGCPVQKTKGPPSPGKKPKSPHSAPRPQQAGDGLFAKIASFESLYQGYLRARRGKREQVATAEFGADLESNLIQLQNELMWGHWEPSPYDNFEVHEPKTRTIHAPAFRDRVLHQSIHFHLTPIYEKVFLPQSYACRVAKGTHAGAAQAQRLIRRYGAKHDRVYALKADIKSYFQSIDHSLLKELLRMHITCPMTLSLLDKIIDTSPAVEGVGIPLGNLTSQLFANVYLHELDHHIVRVLKQGSYVRYMDDFVIISPNKEDLGRLRAELSQWLHTRLHLTLNSKTQVFPVHRSAGRSLDFLGFKIWHHQRSLRRRSIRKGFARARDYARDPNPHNLDRLTSWYAHARYAEPTGLMRRIFSTIANPPNNPSNN